MIQRRVPEIIEQKLKNKIQEFFSDELAITEEQLQGSQIHAEQSFYRDNNNYTYQIFI